MLEWFQRFGGVERVVAGMRDVFPQADFFALVHDQDGLTGTPLEGVPVQTSFIQKLPWSKKKYRSYLPLMPLAVEQFDLRPYDVVLSSSHTVSKGVLTRPDQLHVSYTHTPVRFAWDLYLDYLEDGGLTRGTKGAVARLVLHYLRMWDASAANRVDAYLVNSAYVGRRVENLYRRSVRVIHPPVDVNKFRCDLPREDFYITVSRLVPYKRLDIIVDAFTRMHKPLVVIGDGPERARLERMAGPSVRFLGYQPDDTIADYLQRARAFVFAANEDFGIAPVEAQAAGCPVIAYGRGGALETVVGRPAKNATGIFFDDQTPEELGIAVRLFEKQEGKLSAAACRRNAERFAQDRFREQLRTTVEDLWLRFQRGERLDYDDDFALPLAAGSDLVGGRAAPEPPVSRGAFLGGRPR